VAASHDVANSETYRGRLLSYNTQPIVKELVKEKKVSFRPKLQRWVIVLLRLLVERAGFEPSCS
jgi:hypothetical protein